MKGRHLLDAMEYIDDELIEEAAPLLEVSSEGQKRKKRVLHANLIGAAAAALAVAVSLWVWKGDTLVKQTEENAAQNHDVEKALMTADARAVDEDIEADAAATEMIETEVGNTEMEADIETDTEMTDKLSGTEYSKLSEAKDDEAINIIEELTSRVSNDSQDQAVSECYEAPQKGGYSLDSALVTAIDYYENNANTMDLTIYKNCVYHVTIDIFGERTEEGGTVYEELQFSEDGREKLCAEYNRLLAIGMSVSLSEDYELTGLLSSEEIKSFKPCSDYGYRFRLINE